MSSRPERTPDFLYAGVTLGHPSEPRIPNSDLVGLRRVRLRRWLVVVVPFRPEQPAEEAFFLLLLLVGSWCGNTPRRRRYRRLLRARLRRLQRRLPVDREAGRDGGLGANPEDFLEEVALIAGALVAGLCGRGSV